MIGIGIGIGVSRMRGLYRAIQAMFAQGEKGVIYDPSDLTSMYQESTGITPAVVASPVGLLLDKSQGLVLGTELVVNGTFDSDTAWTKGIGWVISSGVATHTGTTASNLTQSGILTVGKTYKITATLGNSFSVYCGSGTVATNQVGSVSLILTCAGSADFYIRTASADITADNISIKELPGYHATQATSTARPILARHPITGRRNLLTYTEDFSNAAWIKTGGGVASIPVITANFSTAPDGTTTATRIQLALNGGTTSTDRSIVSQIISVVSTTPARSLWMKSNTGANFLVLMEESSIGAKTVTPVWQQFSTAVAVGQTTYDIALRGSLGSSDSADISVWHPQVEESSTPTAYQKVVSTYDVTEAGVNDAYRLHTDGVDDALIEMQGGGGTTGFFLCAGIRVDAGAGTARTIWSDAGTNTGYIIRVNTSNQLEIAAGNGTAYTLAATTDTITVGTTYVVTAWDDGANITVQVNSGTSGTAARPVVSAGTATATIGKNNGDASGFLHADILPLVYVKNGENVDAAKVAATKAWVASKVGVTL